MNRELLAEKVAAQLRSEPSLAAALEGCRDSLAEILPYDRLTLVQVSEDGQGMAVRWAFGGSEPPQSPEQSPITRSILGTPAEWALREGRPLVERDTLESPFKHHPVRDAGRRSFLLLPLGSPPAQGLIGWSMVEPDCYSEGDVSFVLPIAEALGERLQSGAFPAISSNTA